MKGRAKWVTGERKRGSAEETKTYSVIRSPLTQPISSTSVEDASLGL